MAENKTKPTDASVHDYIASRANAQQHAVFWEFAEFTSDALFGTRAQLGLEDTLLDMALGVAGGMSYVGMAWRQGTVGSVVPLRVAEGVE